MIDIEIVEGAGSDELRAYILLNPRTLMYAEPRFLNLITNHLCANLFWMLARRNGLIVGLLIFVVKDGPLGPVFNSLPYYGSNGGVIQAEVDVSSKAALIDAFYEMAINQGAISATIITNPLENDAEFYESKISYDFRDERIGQFTHFPGRIEDLIKSFDDPRPRNIRRAINMGVTVSRGGVESIEFLYRTHVANMAAIGGTAKSREFFNAIPNYLNKGDWAIFTALLDGKPVAALLVFYFNCTVEYFTPVIVELHRSTQALPLIIFKAMCDAMTKGYVNWNWGGTWLSQGGVYDFKKRWGTREYPYYYYTRVMDKGLVFCESKFLLEHYSGFFLIPFRELRTLDGKHTQKLS